MCRIVNMADVREAVADDRETRSANNVDYVPIPNLDCIDSLDCIEHNRQPLAGILAYIRE